jgi:copper chaperone
MSELTFNVEGMACGGCAKAVEKIIQKQDPAAQVSVDLEKARVTAKTSADAGKLAEALTAGGYPAKAA